MNGPELSVMLFGMVLLGSAKGALSVIQPLQRRFLFSLPNLPFLPSRDSKPQNYNEERVLPYSQKELYAIVADVASYPRFIPFCTGSRIDSLALHRALKEQTIVDAQLTVGFLNFTESYNSIVTCNPFESVQAVASSSTPLFKTLSTEWCFLSTETVSVSSATGFPADISPSTRVKFSLQYEFANPIHASLSAAFFGQVSGLMIKAFEDRCLEVYGHHQQRN